jgi:Flp pilus assembly protein TadD
VRRCENCKTEILFEESQFCEHCGATLTPSEKTSSEASSDDDLIISESADDTREVPDKFHKMKSSEIEDLELQSSADVIRDLVLPDSGDNGTPTNDHTMDVESSVLPKHPSNQTQDMNSTNSLRKLSPEEVKSIEKNLYSTTPYLSTEEKDNLLKTVQKVEKLSPAKQASIEPHPEPNNVNMPKRSRGIAFFMKNIIQVRGELYLQDNDEIQINDRVYLLRKKRFSPKLIIGTCVGIFAILLVAIGSQFITNTSNKGEVIGVVLDQNLQPYLFGATIKFTDLDMTFTSNGQGFFKTSKIPTGSHKIEYVVNGQTISTDYATVTSNEISTIALKPQNAEQAPIQGNQQNIFEEKPLANLNQKEGIASNSEPVTTTQSTSDRRTDFAKITLAANIEGAKFTLDGTPLGAGNLTYNRIKPGKHTYIISKDGFGTVMGTVDVSTGENQVLEVALSPSSGNGETAEVADPKTSVQNLIRDGKYTEAISTMTNQINQEPNHAAFYSVRAMAYKLNGNKPESRDDFIKAASIYRNSGQSGEAMTAYNDALNVDPKAIPALLGRADLHMVLHEEIAAVADYETLLSMDKRNAQALCGLGEARYSQGNFKQAIKYFKEARSVEPNNPSIHQSLMLAYLGDDDLKNVKKSYEKFVELASQEQVTKMQSDKRYNAVLRVVSQDQ